MENEIDIVHSLLQREDIDVNAKGADICRTALMIGALNNHYEIVVALLENKNIISEFAKNFGSQSIVVSIDIKKDIFSIFCN